MNAKQATSHESSPLPFVSVIMPAHNEEQYIGDCLTALKNQNYPADRFEIIVVDNNSQDRTSEIAQSFGVKVLLKKKGPVGAVRNHGAAHAQGEILAFIDSDCVAPPSWLQDGAALVTGQPGAAFGGGCYLREQPYFIEKYWLLSNNNEGSLPKHLIGATFFVTKKLFQQAGLFDEIVTSGEDTKLSESIVAVGGQVLFDQRLNVAHLGNPTTTTAFFKRQVWHSENYVRNFRASLSDPVFHLVCLFYLLLVASVVSILSLNLSAGLGLITLDLCLPILLSIKRIIRAKYRLKQYSEITYIYWLDLVYVCGRCVGLTKGLFR